MVLVAKAREEEMELLIIVASGSANILGSSPEGKPDGDLANRRNRSGPPPSLRFLPKPYAPSELAKTAKKMLGLRDEENDDSVEPSICER
jgi:hypothetical protein